MDYIHFFENKDEYIEVKRKLHKPNVCYVNNEKTFFNPYKVNKITFSHMINSDNINNEITLFNLNELDGGISLENIYEMHINGEKLETPTNVYTFTSEGEYDIELFFNTDEIENLSNIFANNTTLYTVDFSDFDSKYITNISDGSYGMFQGCSNLISVDLNNFNFNNIIDLSNLFNGCVSLFNVNLRRIKTSNVQNMSNMFYNCSSLNNINMVELDTTSVVNMNGMFYGCSSIETFPFNKLNTSNVTDMSNMFYGCIALKSININKLDTSKTTTMTNMFYGCTALSSISLTNVEVDVLTDISGMFQNCSGLQNITMAMDISKVTNIENMFTGISSEKGTFTYNLTKYNYDNLLTQIPETWVVDNGIVMTMVYNVSDVSAPVQILGKEFNISQLNGMMVNNISVNPSNTYTFETTGEHTIKVASKGGVTNLNNLFNGCTTLQSITFNNVPMENVESCNRMFNNCSSLITIDGNINELGNAFTGESSNVINLNLSENISKDSLLLLFNGLYNLGENASYTGHACILIGDSTLSNLTDEELAIITGKGWNTTPPPDMDN